MINITNIDNIIILFYVNFCLFLYAKQWTLFAFLGFSEAQDIRVGLTYIVVNGNTTNTIFAFSYANITPLAQKKKNH